MEPATVSSSTRAPKPPQVKQNPISAAVQTWLNTLPAPTILQAGHHPIADITKALVDTAPKRWVVYEPMVLLPSGSFLLSETWNRILTQLDEQQRVDLWRGILREIGATTKTLLRHLAVNEGIPAKIPEGSDGKEGLDEGMGEENVLRSPSHLRILCGDFGPATVSRQPTRRDLEAAFWVTTRQNGIVQTWAPRWTMFSRGNVKEKARLLGFHREEGRRVDQGRLRQGWAVDLYAGIGYFVFSYAKLGMRVLCWEINPWSVEGLRRGAGMNGWTVRVVEGEELKRSTPDIVFGGDDSIVVFLEDNKEAGRRIEELRAVKEEHEEDTRDGLRRLDIIHVNCGLLPQSTPTWRPGLEMLGAKGGWLHVHENVGVADIERRRDEIQTTFEGWLTDREGEDVRAARVEHVERVKTFAPGVWHCVYDVCITGPDPT